jgi:hypothetical protein
MFAQQHSGSRIEQAHMQPIPLHADHPPDPSRRRAVICRFNLDAPIKVHGAFAVLVIAKRFERQRHQCRFLLGEHRGNLAFGAAMYTLIGPALLPVIEVCLCRLKAFEALT